MPDAPIQATVLPGSTSTHYAGFWRRFLAMIIDAILINIVMSVAFIFLPGSNPPIVQTDYTAYAEPLSGLRTLVTWLYFAGLESSEYQATVGKMALGIIVTDERGKRITFWRALGRNVAKILSGVILLIGFFMAAFTRKKQALHDMIAGCLVVKK